MQTILLLAIIFPMRVFSQTGWNYLPNAPLGAGGRFDDTYFANDSTGWAVDRDGEIYMTTDYGNSWSLQLWVPPHYFRAVEFLDNLNGFAGTLDSSVYHTTDGGVTWTLINQNFPNQVSGICGIGHFGSTIIMVGVWTQPAYIMRSTDSGQTWVFTSLASYASGLIDCWFKGQDTVFISGLGTNATNNYGIILRSTDGGITWQQVGQSQNANTYCWKLQFTSPSIGYSSCEEFMGSSSHILKTIDGGASWSSFTVVNQNINMQGIGFVNDSIGWVGGWSVGMYQTNDGGKNWLYQNFGANLNRFYFLNSNLGYAAGVSIYKFTGLTTGINPSPPSENKNVHDFDLFPNPATDLLNIILHINRSTQVIFEVYDINGKKVKELAHGWLIKNSYSYKINLSELPEGNYFVVLRTNEHFLTKKFIVVKKF